MYIWNISYLKIGDSQGFLPLDLSKVLLQSLGLDALGMGSRLEQILFFVHSHILGLHLSLLMAETLAADSLEDEEYVEQQGAGQQGPDNVGEDSHA